MLTGHAQLNTKAHGSYKMARCLTEWDVSDEEEEEENTSDPLDQIQGN